MTQFGSVGKYENAVYTFTFTPAMLPRTLSAVAPASNERDFLIVPEMATTQNFPAVGQWPLSQSFGAHFYYLGGKRLEVHLQSEKERVSVASMSFAVVRWNPRNSTPLPAYLDCVAQDPEFVEGKQPIVDIVRAHRGSPIREEA